VGFLCAGAIVLVTPPEETEHGTRPGGRGPGGVPGGVGSKNKGGHMRVYRGSSIRIQRGVYPYCHVACVSVRRILNRIIYRMYLNLYKVLKLYF